MDELENQNTQPSILIVDDEKNVISAMQRLLRNEGYRLLSAEDGVQALDLLANESIDLIISDMRMPKMDGVTFLAEAAQRCPNSMRILMSGFSDLDATIEVINKANIYKYIRKPWEEDDLRYTVRNAINHLILEREHKRLGEVAQQQNEQLKELNLRLESKVNERTEQLQQAMRKLKSAYDALANNYFTTVKTFSSLVESKEESITGHSRRVATQAHDLAVRLGLDARKRQDILYAGLLHDVGKFHLPKRLQNLASDAIAQEDRERFETHPGLGESLLQAVEPLQQAAMIIKHHHEKYDGSGYPDKLVADQIPLGARILAVVNDYDSMINGMLFSQKLSQQEAVDYLINNKGKSYDPCIVDEFLKLLEIGKVSLGNEDYDCVKSFELKTGLVLSKDLLTSEGLLLLSEGYLLDDNVINRIRQYEKNCGVELNIFVKRQRGNPCIN